jgi:hypothetical protein
MKIRLAPQLRLFFAALAVLLAGCEGTVQHMREVPATAAPAAPEPGRAMVVFMRPSGLGFAVQSSVFEIKDNFPSLVGIVAAKTKVAHQVAPGKYLFMVIGENADFMTAEVAAGKTYYVRVEPRMGMWKARFGLQPVAQKDLASAELASDVKECRWVEKNAASESWASGAINSIQSKHREYYPDWLKQSEAERPHLRADDGR